MRENTKTMSILLRNENYKLIFQKVLNELYQEMENYFAHMQRYVIDYFYCKMQLKPFIITIILLLFENCTSIAVCIRGKGW
jgi:hypothetical protein